MSLLKSVASAAPNVGVARLVELVFYLLTGLWLFAAAATEVYIIATRALDGVALVALLTSGIVIAALGVTLFGTLAELSGQRARDLYAQRIFETLRRGEEPPPFSLYLRPFVATGQIGQSIAGLSSSGMIMTERVELETQIERATRRIAPLVALGEPLEYTGAGRIKVADDSWQDAITLLLPKARLIVMLPSSRAGTLHEIGMILTSGLIQRTVMIDPPNLSTRRYNQAAEWSKVREAFADKGFSLPEDTRQGLLLFFGEERAPQLREKLDIDAEDRIERLFRRIIKSGALRPAATS